MERTSCASTGPRSWRCATPRWPTSPSGAARCPPNVLKRCRHVVTENARVLAAADAFRASNLTHFGELMRQAHISLRDDFEASCKEIDILVALAGKQPGCFGARLTGGGFGGCTVNLVAAANVEAFTEAMRAGYREATGIAAGDLHQPRLRRRPRHHPVGCAPGDYPSVMGEMEQETIVAISTPAGRGGIGVVRLSGPRAREIVAPLLRLRHPLAAGRARFGEFWIYPAAQRQQRCRSRCGMTAKRRSG